MSQAVHTASLLCSQPATGCRLHKNIGHKQQLAQLATRTRPSTVHHLDIMPIKSFSRHIHLRIIAVCHSWDDGHVLHTNMPTAKLHTVRLVRTDFGVFNIALWSQ
jgi:hypothetical protein